MHMVTCKIALGGDTGQIVWRQAHKPVSWPEVGVIQMLHGEESVFDVEVCAEVEATRSGEKARLAEIYGAQVLELVYPGRAPMLEMEVPGVTSIPKPKKQRPVKTVPAQPAIGRFSPMTPAAPVPAPEPYREDNPASEA